MGLTHFTDTQNVCAQIKYEMNFRNNIPSLHTMSRMASCSTRDICNLIVWHLHFCTLGIKLIIKIGHLHAAKATEPKNKKKMFQFHHFRWFCLFFILGFAVLYSIGSTHRTYDILNHVGFNRIECGRSDCQLLSTVWRWHVDIESIHFARSDFIVFHDSVGDGHGENIEIHAATAHVQHTMVVLAVIHRFNARLYHKC